MLYRPHRGSLSAAMAELATVETRADLIQHMREESNWFPESERPTEQNTKIEYYCRDDRIGWDTWVVLVNGRPWGFINGNWESEK